MCIIKKIIALPIAILISFLLVLSTELKWVKIHQKLTSWGMNLLDWAEL